MDGFSDYHEKVFFIPYCLYVKAYLKKMKDSQLPFMIIISGVENAPEAFTAMLNRVLKYAEDEIITASVCGDSIDDVIKNAELMGYGSFEEFCCRGIWNIREAAGELHYIHLKLLYILYLTEGIFSPEDLINFITDSGYSSGELTSAVKCLSDYGFIRDTDKLELYSVSFDKGIFDEISGIEDIFSNIAEYISANISRGIIKDFALAAERLKPCCFQ